MMSIQPFAARFPYMGSPGNHEVRCRCGRACALCMFVRELCGGDSSDDCVSFLQCEDIEQLQRGSEALLRLAARQL